MNPADYKKYHEAFMQNNEGSTASHTFLCIFFTVQCTLLVATQPVKNELLGYILEYMVIVVPLINAHTILSDHIVMLNALLFLILTGKFCYSYRRLNIARTFNLPNVFKTDRIQSISIIRGLTYLITVYSILAVDFAAFPRNLAKTEKFGFSFMDTGVGLFALTSGLVHKDLKNHKYTTILKSNKKIFALLTILGIARYFSIKQLDYQEHVTEYGVHWNFFFTLAICKLLSTLLLIFNNNALLLSLITLCVHESALYFGLQNWVFSNAARSDLISANREGLSSSLGYVSLYLFAVYIKSLLNNRVTRRRIVFRKLVSIAVLLWSLIIITNVFRPISRSLANASYCIYLSSIFMTVLAVLYSFEVLFQNEKENLVFDLPPILKSINENGLLFFIIANLLTGAFNLTLFTLLLPTMLAISILNVYMLVNVGIILSLNKYGLKV